MVELSLKVLENSEVASGTLGLKLELPASATTPAEGKKPFSFKPGQYCMLSLGEEEARSLSIACSPTRALSQNYLQFATRNTGSAFKKLWGELKPGDLVKISGPFGRFVLDETQPKIAFLSGGIGITPVKSMLEYACDKQLPTKLVLLYSNRKPEDIPFRSELFELAAANPNFQLVHTLTQAEASQQPWDGRRGKINEALVKETLPGFSEWLYYSCGPPAMVGAMTQLLQGMGVAQERIKTENFEGYE